MKGAKFTGTKTVDINQFLGDYAVPYSGLDNIAFKIRIEFNTMDWE